MAKLIVEISENKLTALKQCKEFGMYLSSDDEAILNGTVLGTCESCDNWCRDRRTDGACLCSSFHVQTGYDFYCGDYVRGSHE